MVKTNKRWEAFGVNIQMLRDSEQRKWLKNVMLEVRAKGEKVRYFDTFANHDFETGLTSYGSLARPGSLDKNPENWPEEDFNRYVARMMMGPSDDVVFFNSSQALINLIEQIDLLEKMAENAEEKAKNAEEKYERATRKGLVRRIISAIHRELSGETAIC